MHEMSIALSVIELASEELQRLDGVNVRALHLRVGKLSAVVPDALRFSFDLAARGTPFENARLEIEETAGYELQLRAFEVDDDDDAPHC
jgi:hydrogenase nickel incorporation protein HypA/HybF